MIQRIREGGIILQGINWFNESYGIGVKIRVRNTLFAIRWRKRPGLKQRRLVMRFVYLPDEHPGLY